MKITWSPKAIDGLGLDIQRPEQFDVIMKCEQGYDLPTPPSFAPVQIEVAE